MIDQSPDRPWDSDDDVTVPVSKSAPVLSHRFIVEMPRKPLLRPAALPHEACLPTMDLPPSLPDNFTGPFIPPEYQPEDLTLTFDQVVFSFFWRK